MAAGDIIELKQHCVFYDAEGYNFMHLREGPSWASRPPTATFFNLWASNGLCPHAINASPPFGYSLRAKHITGASAGTEVVIYDYFFTTPQTGIGSQWNPNGCPVYQFSGHAASGRLLRRRLYPFQSPWGDPRNMSGRYGTGTNAALDAVATRWLHRLFYAVPGSLDIGTPVIWSRKYQEWAYVEVAQRMPYAGTQERRSYGRPLHA